MDFFDGVGPRHQQVLVATFETWSSEVVERKVLDLQVSPHRTVEDDDSFFCCFEQIGHIDYCHFRLPIAD